MLPEVFSRTLRDEAPLQALLDAMEALHAPSEVVLAHLDAWFDPRRAPDAFVPFLAGWVDLHLEVTTGIGRQRELIAAAAEISRWRGTARGLRLCLETATGCQGFVIDDATRFPDGTSRPFHVHVTAPAATRPHSRMIERIIEMEKPVYVTSQLDFAAPPGVP